MNVAGLEPGALVASRFFAPKIADVSTQPVKEFGWRKLVRLSARPGTPAAGHGVESAFVLFNYFQKDLTQAPFADDGPPPLLSVNTQVFLVRSRHGRAGDGDPGYWLDYGTNGKITDALRATFDSRHPVADSDGDGGSVRPYYVPTGCVSCHHNAEQPLLNYIDTDHYEDRLDDDFIAVRDAGWPALFDCGEARDSGACRVAFDALRQLNGDIAEQNEIVSPCTPQYQAVANWLKLHANGNDTHLSPLERSVLFAKDGSDAGAIWVAGDPTDQRLLPLLNQYCFRCHGSVTFNVFDKTAVYLEYRTQMKERVSRDGGLRGDAQLMPTDRLMNAGDRELLIRLLDQMKGGL
jgi:hypothetical protein